MLISSTANLKSVGKSGRSFSSNTKWTWKYLEKRRRKEVWKNRIWFQKSFLILSWRVTWVLICCLSSKKRWPTPTFWKIWTKQHKLKLLCWSNFWLKKSFQQQRTSWSFQAISKACSSPDLFLWPMTQMQLQMKLALGLTLIICTHWLKRTQPKSQPASALS